MLHCMTEICCKISDTVCITSPQTHGLDVCHVHGTEQSPILKKTLARSKVELLYGHILHKNN